MTKNKKTEYRITVGYRAVVSYTVKTDDIEQAKKDILERIKVSGIYDDSDIQDETYGIYGMVDMDKTWNMVNP